MYRAMHRYPCPNMNLSKWVRWLFFFCILSGSSKINVSVERKRNTHTHTYTLTAVLKGLHKRAKLWRTFELNDIDGFRMIKLWNNREIRLKIEMGNVCKLALLCYVWCGVVSSAVCCAMPERSQFKKELIGWYYLSSSQWNSICAHIYNILRFRTHSNSVAQTQARARAWAPHVCLTQCNDGATICVSRFLTLTFFQLIMLNWFARWIFLHLHSNWHNRKRMEFNSYKTYTFSLVLRVWEIERARI